MEKTRRVELKMDQRETLTNGSRNMEKIRYTMHIKRRKMSVIRCISLMGILYMEILTIENPKKEAKKSCD